MCVPNIWNSRKNVVISISGEFSAIKLWWVSWRIVGANGHHTAVPSNISLKREDSGTTALQIPLPRFPTWVYGNYFIFHQLQMTVLLKAEMTTAGLVRDSANTLSTSLPNSIDFQAWVCDNSHVKQWDVVVSLYLNFIFGFAKLRLR